MNNPTDSTDQRLAPESLSRGDEFDDGIELGCNSLADVRYATGASVQNQLLHPSFNDDGEGHF